MKHVLFLGGSFQQLPAIQYAKEQGYYTVLCDFYDDNPGQEYADEFFCISTTDKESILKIAETKNIDGIVAYASDPAAATAAFVGNQLNLPSNPFESVMILSEKDLFRKFLQKNGFNCPRTLQANSLTEVKEKLSGFKFPLMVKPTDSSGSKGVSRINSVDELDSAFDQASKQSRKGNVIIEEFIEMGHENLIGGDIFVVDGKISFTGFLNCHRNSDINPYVPIGKSYPLLVSDERIGVLKRELQKAIDLLNITIGAFNIEMLFDQAGKPYMIEMGPRNGGNYIPQLLEAISGVDLVKATVEAALNDPNLNLESTMPRNAYYATYNLHSAANGILKTIVFSKEIEGNILKKIMYKKSGEKIERFNQSNHAIGIIFLKFGSLEEMKNKMDHMNQFIDIQLMHEDKSMEKEFLDEQE